MTERISVEFVSNPDDRAGSSDEFDPRHSHIESGEFMKMQMKYRFLAKDRSTISQFSQLGAASASDVIQESSLGVFRIDIMHAR